MHKGSLIPGRRSWNAAIALLVTGVAGACDTPRSSADLRPEGAPEVLQVFVTDGDAENSFGYTLVYGEHPNIYPGSTIIVYGGTETGDSYLSDKNNTLATGQKIRVVLDELLNPATVEGFRCACDAPPEKACPAGSPTFSRDPLDCSVCEDDVNDPIESEIGECLDIDFNGLPDDAVFLPGIASIVCEGGSMTYTTGIEDGFYQLSGNQQIPVLLSVEGLGPALVFDFPSAVELPTDADCTIAFDPSVTDKDGNPIPALPDDLFHTEPLVITSTAPMPNASNIAVTTNVALTFNVAAGASISSGVTLTSAAGAVAGTITVSDNMITFDPSTDLQPGTTYTVTLDPTLITDSYGSPLPASDPRVTFTFTTAS